MSQGRELNPAYMWEAFVWMVGGLVLAPILARLNIVHSYMPYLVLRGCTIGFAFYGSRLARDAGGVRRMWRLPYAIIGLVFLFVWGLPLEIWAAIDLVTAIVIGISTPFIRTIPAMTGAAAVPPRPA